MMDFTTVDPSEQLMPKGSVADVVMLRLGLLANKHHQFVQDMASNPSYDPAEKQVRYIHSLYYGIGGTRVAGNKS
jgi:hypothetical protein